MKVAIDVSPLQSGHKVRGVGFYLEHLKKGLLEHFPDNEYIFFTDKEKIDKDVGIVHYPYFDPFFTTLPAFKKYKQIVTVHDLTPLIFPSHFPSGLKGRVSWLIQKHNLRRSDRIITDSESSKKDIVKLVGIPEDKVDVVYLAAAEEFKVIKSSSYKVIKSEEKPDNLQLDNLRTKYKLPEQFVLYVGDVTANKNLPRLIKAIKEINLTLVMVGKSLAQKDFDRSNPWNKDLVEVNKLAEGDKRIIRLGFVPTEDLVALYNAATVFVMPSLYEGFGLPILEAMQSGCPVVTTKCGSLPEVAGDAAYYVDPYDINSIANGIGEVYFSEKLQKELQEKGLAQAKKFSWKLTAEETVESYRKAVA
jgi:glycosyltransferase involved in cell wall biosynthesis